MGALQCIALALASSMLGACNKQVENTCTIDQFITLSEPTAGFDDCGTYDHGAANYTDAAMESARDCVLNDIMNARSFRLVYDTQSSSGSTSDDLRAAFTGVYAGGVMTLESYAGSSKNDMGTSGSLVSERACTTLVSAPSCTPTAGVPCLDCTGDLPGSVLCRN